MLKTAACIIEAICVFNALSLLKIALCQSLELCVLIRLVVYALQFITSAIFVHSSLFKDQVSSIRSLYWSSLTLALVNIAIFTVTEIWLDGQPGTSLDDIKKYNIFEVDYVSYNLSSYLNINIKFAAFASVLGFIGVAHKIDQLCQAHERRKAISQLQKMLTNINNSEMSCPICLMEEEQNYTCQLTCGHTFHKQCLRTWFERKANCPVCRSEKILK